MMHLSFVIFRYTIKLLVVYLFFLPTLFAGLLEMPDVRDSTTLKGKSVYENIDIPEVRERDPNPEGGVRVWVLKVKVQGVVERPEFGITKKGVDDFIEKIRSESMKEEELLKYGYSLEDLSEIADLMVDIDAGKELEKVTEPDVQQLIWLVRQLKERRGLTLVNIEQLADQLTNYYRERGFFLTKAYVPKQEVRKGVVVLTVLEGKLGKVTVSDNERYNEEIISKAFDDLLYQPVTEQEVEQKLYLLNDYPGLDIYGYFKAGDQVGDTWLNLQVRSEKLWSATARVDNHGSELTGRQRFYAEAQLLNPSKIADDVTLGVMKTVSPDNSTYGVFKYSLPVYSENMKARINYTKNQFATQITGSSVVGDTKIVELTGEYSFIRRRERNLISSFHIANKNSELLLVNSVTGQVVDDSLSDKVKTYSLEINYDELNEVKRNLQQGSVSIAKGKIKEGADSGQKDNFKKISGNYSFLSLQNIPWLNINSRLIFKTSFQYSNSALPPVEQFSISGPNAVRAYEQTEFSADYGIYLGLDWVFSMPSYLDFKITEDTSFSRLAQPFLFVDYGNARLKDYTTDAEDIGILSGYGIGLQYNYKKKISGNIQIAKPIKSKFTQEARTDPGNDVRLIVDIQYLFD